MLFLFGLDSIPFTVLVTMFPVRLSTDEHHGPGAAGWGEEEGDGRGKVDEFTYINTYIDYHAASTCGTAICVFIT
jgi:hypothetical protein